MRENFQAALAAVLRFEGGYVDDPRDPGGATARGVTQVTLAAFRGRPVGKAEVAALTAEEAAAIYRRMYWDAVRGDELPGGVDLAVFDLAVNSGPGRAARMLQAVLGVRIDGIIGPATLAACRGAPAARTSELLCDARLRFLQSLPTWGVFGRGWSNRVQRVRNLAGALAASSPTAAPGHGASSPPQAKQESIMTDVKSILSSRTVWSNFIGITALGLSAAGFDTKGFDGSGVVDAGLQVVAGASFLASTFFRVLATRRLIA